MKIGIDIGGSHIAVGIVDGNNIINKSETEINKNNVQEIEEFILTYIVNTISKLKQNEEIELIGIATPGNPKNGNISTMVNLGVDEYNIKEKIEQYYKVPITVRNDAKCAALAEKRYGSLKDYEDAVFLCLGTGIGSAVFLNNQLLVPKRNTGFEIGHMVIEKQGEKCNCGKLGCFETYCSIKRFREKIKNILKIPEEIQGRDFLDILHNNISNMEVQQVISMYIQDLLVGISNIIDIFEPEAISIGGGFAYYKDILYNKLLEEFYNRKYVFNKNSLPEIKLASLGNDAGIIGAVIN